MTAPKRVQRKRTKGWRMPEGAVYVGRPTRWGNPFRAVRKDGVCQVIDEDGQLWSRLLWVTPKDQRAAALKMKTTAVVLFAQHTSVMGQYEIHHDDLEELRGHDLACWCPIDDEDGHRFPCHADVLLALANHDRPLLP